MENVRRSGHVACVCKRLTNMRCDELYSNSRLMFEAFEYSWMLTDVFDVSVFLLQSRPFPLKLSSMFDIASSIDSKLTQKTDQGGYHGCS
jgi:hypothetical protein